jgi:hypothetical protein
MRVKILYRGSSLSDLTSTSRSITISLFANYDAYINNFQAIVTKTASQIDNCYYPDVSTSTCYINHGNGGGTFLLQKVSDTFIQAAYQPRSTINFGSGNTYHYF